MIIANLSSPVRGRSPRRRPCHWRTLLMVIGLMAAAHAARADVSLPSDTRQRVALDGPWEILQSDSDDLKTLPEEGQWAPVTVPDRRWRGDSNEQPWPKSLWYRRTFDAPELDGRRAMLHSHTTSANSKAQAQAQAQAERASLEVPVLTLDELYFTSW